MRWMDSLSQDLGIESAQERKALSFQVLRHMLDHQLVEPVEPYATEDGEIPVPLLPDVPQFLNRLDDRWIVDPQNESASDEALMSMFFLTLFFDPTAAGEQVLDRLIDELPAQSESHERQRRVFRVVVSDDEDERPASEPR